ncbi:MAG: Por secretion system protein, partial [Bacteroidales bacterium]|nr:Por secretion system protein [Bacteroidales bacterium]
EWNTINIINDDTYGTIFDLVSVAINPFNHNQVFAGAWNDGLVEFINNEVANVYGNTNSSLEPIPVYGYYRIGGLAFDESGNLWVTNSSVTNVLSVRQPDGAWKSFFLGSTSSANLVGKLITNSYGQKWILSNKHEIFVFNENGTINNDSDNDYKMLTSGSGNGNMPGIKVFSIAEDKDGEIWIGTDQGVAVFYSPENVFTNYNFDAQQILVPRNDGTDLADILLENEAITAIAVDGANNKWIGTDRSGIYKLSPDGQNEIHHFTEQNSPLFSNNITSIAINHVSGEVFFGTAKGIISFKSTATEGGETNNDVYAFPNPVRPGYNGVIAINGLVQNASFKITDISGNLIFGGRAEGGRAIWDGKNFDGRKAQTGVYLVFVTNDDGSEKIVTKILFIN